QRGLTANGPSLMRMLITTGPTREYFDSVRFLSNASTGKMGCAVAQEASRRGHAVVLICGPLRATVPDGVEVIHVVTAGEMFDAAVQRFEECHAAVMTAAVCDYRPASREPVKMKKQASVRRVELLPTADICHHLGTIKGDRVLVGFALEDRDSRARAEEKMRRKRCDAMVLNAVETLGADEATVEILRAGTGWQPARQGTKAQIAADLVDLVESLRGDSGQIPKSG
ncbi:MAG: phosphopantothenoylcysteine decarboxylase, partial [Phycisphaerae bacterium]